MDEVSQIDLAFCVDRTTSMTHLLEAARAHMLDILESLSAAVGASLRVAVVAYQDYGGSRSQPVRVDSFSADPGVTAS